MTGFFCARQQQRINTGMVKMNQAINILPDGRQYNTFRIYTVFKQYFDGKSSRQNFYITCPQWLSPDACGTKNAIGYSDFGDFG